MLRLGSLATRGARSQPRDYRTGARDSVKSELRHGPSLAWHFRSLTLRQFDRAIVEAKTRARARSAFA